MPDPNVLHGLVNILRSVTDHCERSIPFYNQARSLSRERTLIMESIFDILIENAHVLADAGALERLQERMADLLDNEIDNMELLSKINADSIQMTLEVKGSLDEFRKPTE